MSTKPCATCKGSGRINLMHSDDEPPSEVDCPACDGTGDDLEAALALIKENAQALIEASGTTRAHELARPGDPYTVPRWSSPAERLAEIDDHELATAFHEMSRFPPPPAPDSTERQREAIGRSIAEYMTNATRGEDANVAANRIVAALGPVEAFQMADVLGKWAGALAARAEKAERMGLKR